MGTDFQRPLTVTAYRCITDPYTVLACTVTDHHGPRNGQNAKEILKWPSS